MTRIPINPGKVDWSGENPGMYLKESETGPFVSLISFFRVVVSSHGKGHAAFMLLDPGGEGKGADNPNVCLTDNEPLARYVCKGFVSHFGAFRGVKGLGNLRYLPGWDFMPGGDGRTAHSEWFRSSIGQVSLTWSELSDPFLVEFDQAHSATGQHEMISLFFDARRTQATINGRPVAGRPFPREFAGKKNSSTAFLAFSESWIKA